MELQYIVLTIIKILISVPTFVVINNVHEIDCAALIGGYVNNVKMPSETNITDLKMDWSEDGIQEKVSKEKVTNQTNESVPDPEALILPGYNLPENIFNKGKPFYLEKDPVTGNIDFNSKTKFYEDYVDEDVQYQKFLFNPKDGPIAASHKPSDINQLTPNFHDYLNLPVKYTSDKYVYPLISSSYANTKVQGNVNKHNNHKNYIATTYKPIQPPNYLTTRYYHNPYKVVEFTTPYKSNEGYPLVNSSINNTSYNVKNYKNENTWSSTSVDVTSTERSMTLFEQLFGSVYEDIEMNDSAEATTLMNTINPALDIQPNNSIPSLPKKLMTSGNLTQYQNMAISSHILGTENNFNYKDNNSTKQPENTMKPILLLNVTPQSQNVESTLITEDYDYDYMEKGTANNITSKLTSIVIELPEKGESLITTTTDENINTTSLPSKKSIMQPIYKSHMPMILEVQNVREQLKSEKVDFVNPQAPSSSSIHIAPDEDIVSFIMGNHQHFKNTDETIGENMNTSLNEGLHDSIPYSSFFEEPNTEFQFRDQDFGPNQVNSSNRQIVLTYKPIEDGEGALSINNQINLKAGYVMDDNIKVTEATNEAKIPFLIKEKFSTVTPAFGLPMLPNRSTSTLQLTNQPNRYSSNGLPSNSAYKEVLKLNSKPMFHQLPSELTPPENIHKLAQRVRPPWDPRPGHFYAGRPEYARPPRPQEVYKRVDTLPNILPQFRPNMSNKPIRQYYMPHGQYTHFDRSPYQQYHQQIGNLQQHSSLLQANRDYIRQPLLERQSNNRPVGFFERPPSTQNYSQSKIHSKGSKVYIDPNNPTIQQSMSLEHQELSDIQIPSHEYFGYLQTPPKIVVPNGESEDPETLQMLQAKQEKKSEKPIFIQKNVIQKNKNKENNNESVTPKFFGGTDTPLYVVYPINSVSAEVDTDENSKKGSLETGTIVETPVPPTKTKPNEPVSSLITETDFNYEVKDRHDLPILKPRPMTFPFKSEFPYPLERPNALIIPSSAENASDKPSPTNKWIIIEDSESDTVNNKIQKFNADQISVTLKTHAEKPIAVAYMPTEINKLSLAPTETYADLVVPDNTQRKPSTLYDRPVIKPDHNLEQNTLRSKLEFQAPFHASAHIDHSMSMGWAVVREKIEQKDEMTTPAIQSTSEFNIENFKPQLEGGFKPIYSYSHETKQSNKVPEKMI